jgi:sphingomyelin phosphodiesterase
VNETFKFASTLNPDFIFWTGDDPAHDIFSQSRADNLENIEILTQMFLKHFPDTFVFPCLGNHDTFPVDQLDRPPNSNWLLDVVGKYWNKWLPPDALKTFKYGGYYQLQLGPKLRLIVLNTLYYDVFNLWVLWNTTGPDPAGQWQWFISALADAKKNNQSVWIMGHIYPGHNQAIVHFSHRFALVSSQYHDIIKAYFFGHSHQDEIRVLRDANNIPYGIMYIAPSVTPLKHQNPSVRIYHYYKDTYEIFDIEQYVADLDKANANGKLQYRLEYTAKKAYGLTSLSPQAWMSVVNMFKTNDTLWQQYYRFWRGEYPHETPCTGICKKTMICEILSIEPRQVFECLQQ